MQTMQNTQPVAATLQMQVTLEAQQWNQILAVLGDAPYRIAMPLIQTIGEQLQAQADTGQADITPPQPRPSPNGAVPSHFPTEV